MLLKKYIRSLYVWLLLPPIAPVPWKLITPWQRFPTVPVIWQLFTYASPSVLPLQLSVTFWFVYITTPGSTTKKFTVTVQELFPG